MKPQVDLLLRKSKIVREGEWSLSIRAQEERGRRWAEENGHEVRKIWRENISAWSDIDRPVYDAAMTAVLNGEVPVLWVYALDRFSRKGVESIVPILGRARVIFDYEQLDSSRERDRRWIIQRAEDAREYSARLSYNLKAAKARQRDEGRWLSKPPFGFRATSERKLVPDPDTWPVIERIFRTIASGDTSARALCRQLNAEGVPGPAGRGWRAGTVAKIIKHPVYEGWATHYPTRNGIPAPYLNRNGQRVRVLADGESAIPAETAERARRHLAGHLILDNTPVPGRPRALLTGLLFCEGCGKRMAAEAGGYRCALRAQGGPCPERATIMKTTAEFHVIQRWMARLEASEPTDSVLHAVAERWQALTHPELSAEIREATEALRSAEAALERFHADDRAGFYDGPSARYRLPAKREAESRVAAAQERLAALTPNVTDISFILNGDAREAWEAADHGLRRDLLRIVINRVYVRRAGRPGEPFQPDRLRFEWVGE